MGKRSRGGTPATVALTDAGIAFTEHTYDHDPSAESYGLEAAEALGVDPASVFKTLVVQTEGAPKPELVVGVVPVEKMLDLKAVAAVVGAKKARMADLDDVRRSSGYVLGGVSPVGQRTQLRTVIDDSAEAFPTMYVSGGRRGFDIGLSPTDLQRVCDAVFAPIAR